MSEDHQRKDNHCTKRIDDSWRRPRGNNNKQRLDKRGQPSPIKTGYKTKQEDRHKWNGKTVITVTTKDEINDINTDTEAARIPTMGRKKKTPLVQHAVDNDVDLVNLDADQYIEQTQAFLKERKERQKQREQEEKAESEAADEESGEDDEQSAEQSEEADDGADETEDDSEEDDEQSHTASDDEVFDAADAPTSDNTVKEIKAWLDDHSIEYKSRMLKADLLDLVDEHTEEQ